MAKGVFLWSPPRCLSTAVEISIRELPCVSKVFHEPYATPFFSGPERTSLQYADSPVDSSRTYASVTDKIRQSLLDKENGVVFVKEISYYINDHTDVLLEEGMKNAKHTFLIRHPALAVRSLYKGCHDNNFKFDLNEIGFKEMYKIYKCVKNNLGDSNPVVIDATDVLMDPEGMLKSYCEAVGVNYKVGMSRWSKKYSHELLDCNIPICSGWHDTVFSSNGINKAIEPIRIPAIEDLPEAVREIVEDVLPYYDDMKKASLQSI